MACEPNDHAYRHLRSGYEMRAGDKFKFDVLFCSKCGVSITTNYRSTVDKSVDELPPEPAAMTLDARQKYKWQLLRLAESYRCAIDDAIRENQPGVLYQMELSA